MTINGKTYENKPITLDSLLEIERLGSTWNDLTNRPFTFLVAYTAYCMGADTETAKREIEKFVYQGGDLPDLVNGLTVIVAKSPFAR